MEERTLNNAGEINSYLNSLGILQYAAVEEKMFDDNLAQVGNYERKTTFYSDLSIAERYDIDFIKETCKNVIEHWLDDIEFITEFVMCLNYKSWEWLGRDNEELCELYSGLFYEIRDKLYDHFENDNEALSYFYRVTD